MKRIFNQLNGRFTAIALGGAIVLAGSAVAFSEKPKAESFTPSAVDERPIARDLGGHGSFAPVVKKVAPGVVKVFTTTKVHNTSYNGMPGDMDDMFRRFFGDQLQGRMPRHNLPMTRQEGIGSGVIATKDGYILTN